ncbi:MAG: DUF4105 domain-containing protein, partial [Mariprofundaceae bacterium]
LDDSHPICRFPARFQWVLKSLHLNASDFPKPECLSYDEYTRKVPVDDVKLVFASENIISPSSMMGHVFLMLSGRVSNERVVEHAVTYFTLLDSLNVPKIVYQNLFGGMPGLFALQPYNRIRNNYLKVENRNIWEYSLKLNDNQKEFIRSHIWELKGMESDYLFGDYNCATITYFLIALAIPEDMQATPHWLSPIDVVKSTHEHLLVKSTEVVTSDHWKIHMLRDQVANSFDPTIISKKKPEELAVFLQQQSPLEKIYTQTYIQYLRDHEPTSYEEHGSIYDESADKLSRATKNLVLDYSYYKDPVKAPGSQHFQVGYGRYKGNDYLDVGFFPAAIRLTDDQRQYFSARELRMFEINAQFFPNLNKIKIENITLYSVKSLTPWNKITKSFSGQWRLNGENHFDQLMNRHFVLNGSAGLGYTYEVTKDISLSGLYNVGIASDFRRTYLYYFPEITLQISEIGDMKTTVSLSSYFHMYNSNLRNDEFQVCQSYYWSQSTTFLGCGKRIRNRKSHLDQTYASIEWNF